ncbi:hypothetical protein FD723_36550 (plasmid) [Nostoc sp. C052]|uniref:hypothetical protein n=1 Tax=Nostoc sp. C052 TaxID=2576902 RepID=UPI0015C3A356|nr:hypothetical protein [Nostoc sp. C052]QLE45764.1 hypothetical protein FD723_36550 [Nostoc sp. C052]
MNLTKTILNALEKLLKVSVCIGVMLILSIIYYSMTELPEAIAAGQASSSNNIIKTATYLNKFKSFLEFGDSFLPDISILRASFSPTFQPTFAPTFQPTFAPTISLIGRVDFYFQAQELNLIKIIIWSLD